MGKVNSSLMPKNLANILINSRKDIAKLAFRFIR